jgi:hypothetical protein
MWMAVVACALLVGAPRAARAERSALFVGVGTSDDAVASRGGITKTARATIEAAGWSVIEPPVDAGPLNDLLTCVQNGLGGDCVPGYLDDHDVDRGVIVRVVMERGKKGTTHTVTGWVFRRAGELLVTDKRTCDRCADHAVETTVRELVEALVKEARERARPTLLDIRSIPTGATVKIDGKAVGATDLQIEVYAGVHAVYFEKAGYHGESREVVVGDGESMTVEVRLTPDDQEKPAGPIQMPVDEGPKRSKLPYFVTAGGVALLAGGVVLLTMDESAVQDELQVPEYRDTTLPAIGLLGVGAAVTGLGVWMILSAGGDDETPTPAVSLTPGGATLGVSSRF